MRLRRKRRSKSTSRTSQRTQLRKRLGWSHLTNTFGLDVPAFFCIWSTSFCFRIHLSLHFSCGSWWAANNKLLALSWWKVWLFWQLHIFCCPVYIWCPFMYPWRSRPHHSQASCWVTMIQFSLELLFFLCKSCQVVFKMHDEIADSL